MTTRKILSVVVAASVLAGQAQTYYGNGYTIIEQGTVDDRLSGLDAMVFKSIDAYSVQEGLEQLLQGSGWALAGADNADPQIWRLYRQPWPDNKRTLNPMPLSQALSWVAGDGWSLVIDPVNRLVSFEVNARYAARPTPAAATVANAPADAALPPATGYTRVTPTNPYTAIVSYADSPSYAASHGDSFHDSSYTASANALMVSPPDYHDGYNPPPRQTVRDTKPLRPAAANIADLKTVSAGTGAGKTPSASGKNRRKTADSPALLPVATDEKTISRTTSRIQKNAGAATATNPVATTATGKKAAAQAATAPKSAAATATDTAKKSAADSAAQAAASSGKTAAPATEPAKKGATGAPDAAAPAATAQQTATTPATGTKTGAPALLHEKPSATPAQTTATNSHSGENRP
ncbi:MAG: hypothetical protein ACFN9G_00900 [Cardiobacterium sp.]